MIDAFSIIVINVFFRIVHVNPAADLHGQLLWMAFCFFEICVVPLFPILESGSLCTSDALESDRFHVRCRMFKLPELSFDRETYRNTVWTLVANAMLFLPASLRQAAIEIPSSMA